MTANQHDWHSSISATDRYGAIRSIQEALADGSMTTAMSIEQAAYNDSASLDDYAATCKAAIAATASTSPSQDNTSGTIGDARIGSYTNCVAIADGVTSTVYRSSDGTTALKVITAHHPLPPHNPQREIRILRLLGPPCIPLLDAFRDQTQQQVLAFPCKPLTLEALIASQAEAPLAATQTKAIFADVLRALAHIHAQGIIHRDVKPSAILLDSPAGPAHLSDFGIAWHPALSAAEEPAAAKILDIGTGPYRAPDMLFVNKAYGTEVDVWALGVMLAECLSAPPRPPFESRAAQEDGNQLGLILSIFKTMGTPTPETWPEAERFQVSPFQMWTVFPQRSWREILPAIDPDWLDMIASTVRYSKRATAEELLQHKCIQ
ncbi:Protein kinase-like domain protein [Akanthomyces lecanii RCEF 1005]|uniref:cyclin-dependent kinase n=1 Tax=Akanthomyces lecanii RCEF 1005 TaxID=1081108 RepID=A0A168GKS7_CORDF|nr:Protein kinase-like domain protein [Akanthomyces lecanii RCEF 1005]